MSFFLTHLWFLWSRRGMQTRFSNLRDCPRNFMWTYHCPIHIRHQNPPKFESYFNKLFLILVTTLTQISSAETREKNDVILRIIDSKECYLSNNVSAFNCVFINRTEVGGAEGVNQPIPSSLYSLVNSF